MSAASGFLIALKCIQFVFGRGSAPHPIGGAYSAPSDPLTGLRCPTSKGMGGKGRERERERRTGEEENGRDCPFLESLDPPFPTSQSAEGGRDTLPPNPSTRF